MRRFLFMWTINDIRKHMWIQMRSHQQPVSIFQPKLWKSGRKSDYNACCCLLWSTKSRPFCNMLQWTHNFQNIQHKFVIQLQPFRWYFRRCLYPINWRIWFPYFQFQFSPQRRSRCLKYALFTATTSRSFSHNEWKHHKLLNVVHFPIQRNKLHGDRLFWQFSLHKPTVRYRRFWGTLINTWHLKLLLRHRPNRYKPPDNDAKLPQTEPAGNNAAKSEQFRALPGPSFSFNRIHLFTQFFTFI